MTAVTTTNVTSSPAIHHHTISTDMKAIFSLTNILGS